MNFDKIYWCTKGFTPQDTADGKCEKFNEYQYGCHSCKDWKLVPVAHILTNQEDPK